jgi:hypothetical protein
MVFDSCDPLKGAPRGFRPPPGLLPFKYRQSDSQ